jgi:hypothetical protein
VEQYENIYDKIKELLGGISGNVSILEEQIDADVQMEYYHYTQNLKEDFDPKKILKKREVIFGKDKSIAYKKKLIVQLASIDSIEAYRTLEKFMLGNQSQLKDWATLAMKECRLLIESKLLDRSQVLISTGLGGKGLKLRYFTVLLARNSNAYNPFQKKVISNELTYAVKNARGELEKISFDRELCTVLSIIPLQIPVQGLFDQLIAECNNYGDFVNPDYIITNVKVIPNREVRELIIKSRKTKKTRID